MTRPDLFIVGAPKCGTTSLANYLGQHPQVFMSRAKEPFFFATDLSGGSYWSADQYRKMFERAGSRVSGEATTWYLYSRTAALDIRGHNANAKIVIILRNPVEMLPSLHQHLVYNENEDLVDFGEALAAEGRRRDRRDIPRTCRTPYALQYTDVARFSVQVQRYLSTFPREQVHVVIFDDFESRTSDEVARVYEFLGVDPSFEPELQVYNPAKAVRSRWAHRIMQSPTVHRVARLATPMGLRPAVADFMLRLNKKRAPRPPMAREIETHLCSIFADEIDRLSALLDRDLTHWCRLDKPSRH